METSISNEAKKLNLEELSKEELIKKCKGLLTIAQKAKQAKDILQEENTKLKHELTNKSKNDAAEELVESLTQQKLSLVNTIEDLKTRNSSLDSKLQIFEKELKNCQEKLNTADNESISYKRQVTRLTDENEQLITHLDSLEKQIDELNKIGIQQRQQLLELESKARDSKNAIEENKVTELQCMLSVSLEEVKKLKSENSSLNEKIENLNISLSEKNKNIFIISEELKSKCDTLDKVTVELNELQNVKEARNEILEDYEKLKAHCKELTEANKLLLKDMETSRQLEEQITECQDLNNRLKEKLKLYHSKIIKFAGSAKVLKEEKNTILQLFKKYTDQVKEWKERLNIASESLVALVNTVQCENEKLKEDIIILKQEDISRQLDQAIDLKQELNETISNYELQLKTLKQENEAEVNIIRKKLEDSTKTIDEHKNKIEILNTEKEHINKDLISQKNMNNDLSKEIVSIKNENDRLIKALNEYEANISKETQSLLNSNEELKSQIDLLLSEKRSIDIIVKQNDVSNKRQLEDYQNKLVESEKHLSDLQAQLKKYEDDEKKLAEKSSEEIMKLVEENKKLSELNNALQEKVEEFHTKRLNMSHNESQTNDDLIPTNELEEQIVNLKRENTELLSEMNEMNQALKERGENISKLQAHCEEVMKKLQIYETQANKNVDSISEKEEIIKNLTEEISSLRKNESNYSNEHAKFDFVKEDEVNRLKSEIENLKEKLSSTLETSYAESETMSTSTVSRTEDMNRLRDLEGSWEERYGKLRNLAIKLKGKIRELSNTLVKEQTERDELQKKLSTNLKTIQTLQNQSDKLQDELENSKQECKQYLNRLNTIAEDISKDKQSLVNKDDVISELKKEIDTLKNEKQSTESWKKQVSGKVQMLRKELEANNLLKKDFENKITKLTAEFEAKEQALKAEIESHKQTKSLLDASNNECKKNSVLNLEMQDYERSVKETAKKLEKQQEQMTKWKGQVESQKSTINALREQNKMLEERVQEAENNLSSVTTEINTYKKKVAQLEEEIQQKEEKIQDINQLLETSRSETEELSTELSKVIAEHQKTNNILKSERDLLRSQTLGFQQNLREAQDALKLKEDELVVIRNEYEGYKVRAQSVLRQNQNRDVGLEEKLTEQVASLNVQNSQLTGQLEKCV